MQIFCLLREVTERNEDLNATLGCQHFESGNTKTLRPGLGPVAQIRIKTSKRAFHCDPDPT